MTPRHPPPNSPMLAPRLAAVAILLAAWALRIHALGAKSLWYDELRQVEVAQSPLRQMSPLLIEHAARPLDYVLTHLWMSGLGPVDAVPGRAEFWLRFPAALWSQLAVAVMLPLAHRWTRARSGRTRRPAAWLAMALLAAAPLAVQYAQELRPYALYLLLSLLAFYLLDRAMGPAAASNRGWVWVGYGLTITLGALTHFFFAFVLAAQTVWVSTNAGLETLRGRRPRLEHLGAFAAGAAVSVAALFVDARPAHLVRFARQFAGALVGAPTAGLVSDRGLVVRLDQALNADFFWRGLLPFYGAGGGLALVLFVGLALLGSAALAARSRPRLALGALWLLLAPALVIIYLQYRQEFFALRYVLFALPIYLVLVALGVEILAGAAVRALARRPAWTPAVRGGVWALGAALLLGLQLGQVARDYRQPKDDWRRVGQFLTANVRPGDTLGAPDVQAFIRFYAPGQAGAIIDADDRGPHEQALANGERFWFVWSDYTFYPIPDTRAWVQSLPSVTIHLDPRIKVIYVHPGLTQAEMLAEAQRFVVPPPTGP